MASPTILHVDMDAFFASVEQLDNPALRGLCVVVGGSHRGVVAAASYEARKYGIRSAMPIYQARLKCPHLVIVPPRRSRYGELSHRIMDILRNFSPLVEPVSIDEAYVDMTGCERLHGDSRRAALTIKARIKEQTGLTCSVGIAPNKFLAKIASDLDKPDGLSRITPEQMPSFLETLPIEKVPGVGLHAQQRLSGLGVRTLGQIRRLPEPLLIRRLGKFGHRLFALAQGRDDSPVVPESAAKSVSSETTLDADTLDRNLLAAYLLTQSETVARQLRRRQVRARTITLKLKFADFEQRTRSHTLARPVQASDVIYQTALALLASHALDKPIRLIGVGAANLQSQSMPVQQEFSFESAGPANNNGRWEKVERALDAITERYGRRSILRGTLAGGPPSADDKKTTI